jgi:putative peptide zinc metalloprotease protein
MWHRVRALAPRLRPHVQITRQHYRGRRWHVVHDPSSNQFYRLNPIAHEFVSMLDGRRTVEAVWEASLQRNGDSAPTQQEVVELLGQLYNSNLLSADASPEVEQLLRRGRERIKRKVASQAIGIMYFRMRLFNPDRLLSWIEPILRPALNRWGLLVWALWVGAALVMLAPHWDLIWSGAGSAIAPANWGWLLAVFVVTKAWHEIGHGVITRRFGGQVPEFGAMLLVLLPSPYVDASACWAFPSKWQRVAVGAGGMIFELGLAAGAAMVWIATLASPESLTHQLAFNAMFTAGITTVLFNANPLMRFDGYYILSDLLEVPNLMQRSQQMLLYLAQKLIYRVKHARPPTTAPAEQAILVVYGVLACAYRVFLFFSITVFLMGKMFGLGLALAIWTATAWFVIPAGKFIHWLASSPQLAEFRGRAVVTSVAIGALLAVVFGVIRVPDRRRAWGVVESRQQSGIFFGTEGFVVEAFKRPGDRVGAGEAIARCQSPELEATLTRARAQLAEIEAVERGVMATSPIGADVARERIETLRRQIGFFEEQESKLTVRAPHSGVIVGSDPMNLVGSYARRGDALCEVVDTEDVWVTAALTTAEAAPLIEVGWRPPEEKGEAPRFDIEMRMLSDPGTVLRGTSALVLPAGQNQLPHAALGYAGGGAIETDPRDQNNLFAVRNQFFVYVTTGAGAPGAPGERVAMRFVLPDKPLAFQWLDRFRRLVQGKVKL